MAATDETTSCSSLSTSSYDTALCVIPPSHQYQGIDQLRSLYDKAYGKWPPHVNLIYPFVAPESLSNAKERIQSRLAHSRQETPFSVHLNTSGHFAHRTNNTIFLCERHDTESSSLTWLRSTALEALGQTPSPCNFHLTIGQSEDQTESSRDFLLGKAKYLPSLQFPIQSLAILVRERHPSGDKSLNVMRLWGTIEIPTSESSSETPISEFWLASNISPELNEDPFSDDENEDARVSAQTSTFSREVQPGTTYRIDSTSTWRPNDSDEAKDKPSTITVSNYNVLIDSEYPPARDRDPLILDAILSKLGSADILVLQEVSDDFLSFLLADASIQQTYSFTSHGPPNQPDIGPLPSLRNVVILSKWQFSWKLVPFQRRHKGALIAEFDILNDSHPLIVAGIHLTCGLTDGSVAAKKTQLHNLKSYLSRNYPENSWIVAGDFNITTSTHTIQNALKHKAISQQTSRNLISMETSLAEEGFVDAWTVARIEGTDTSASADPIDDLFEGEYGATFNPRENVLAAATSGTSRNRPQRYDRILVRSSGTLRVQRFNQFGLPEEKDGIQVVPSDHSGIRALLKVSDASKANRTANAVETVQEHPVVPQHVSELLSDGSALQDALVAHHMFPSTEETVSRREAFKTIKEVILGSSDDEATSASDIPMVIVSVGSYALNVWTSTSDIDCLCIGSISSKTFFKLARQRIHRAQSRGVRLLRKVEANTGTMLELSVNDVNIDLQYCPAARIVERWSEYPELHSSDPIFNLPMLSLRKLKPYRDLTYIQRTVPSLPTFRTAYRCIKLWAVQRGLYSSRFGYLSGTHITLMLSWVCKRLVHDQGSVTAQDLVASFFHHYAEFDWKNDMVYDAFFHKQKPRYHRSAREPMVVLGFHTPNANVAHTSTGPGLHTLLKEFRIAHERLSTGDTTWSTFFGQSGQATAMAEFQQSYQSYVKITIQYWGRTLAKGKELVGWVESRCLLQVVDIHKALPDLDVRIWPARFTNNKEADSETDYQGCYLIGLSRQSNSETYTTEDEKAAAKQTLQQSLDKFLSQLHSDDKYYDPSTSWIDVTLVQPNAVKDLVLDQREWGDYIPEMEPDSDDEEEEDALEDPEETSTIRNLPQHPTPQIPSSTQSTPKLRPASDVLNRLRWDPALDPSDYIVGYEDRFLGAKETGLERWKTEQTDDEFIPQHRILWFRRRGDGVVVWERKSRVDLVFGSGVGAG